MKTKFLLVSALLIGLFTACSNDDENNPTPPKDGTVELEIRIKNSSITTKAFDDPATGSGTERPSPRIVLKNFYVYAFDGDKKFLSASPVTPKYSGDGGTDTETLVTAKVTTLEGVEHVYILGNYNKPYPVTGDLEVLQAIVHEQENIFIGEKDPADGDMLIVVGYVNSVSGPADEGDPYTATLSLAPLATKLNVTVTDARSEPRPANDFEFQDISVLYSAAESHVFAQPEDGINRPVIGDAKKGLQYAKKLPTNFTSKTEEPEYLYYVSGLETWSKYKEEKVNGAPMYTDINQANLLRTWTESAKVMEETFYIYAPIRNGGKDEKPLIITLRSHRYETPEGGGEDVLAEEDFYSVLLQEEMEELAKVDNTLPLFIPNGYSYDIKMIIKGRGTTDPEKKPVDLEVTINQATWTIVPEIVKPFD